MIVTRKISGTTARSCIKSTENEARPVPVDMRPWRESNSITIAVEDSASENPITTATGVSAPTI